MERVWVVSEDLYSRRDSVPQNRHAEIHVVKDLQQLRSELRESERAVLLASLPDLRRAREDFPRLLASALLPPDLNQEKLLYSIRSVLQDARLQHDLEAAENVAWAAGSPGPYDDPGIEMLGSSILELSSARDMEAIEETLLHAGSRIFPVSQVKVAAYPETAGSRLLGSCQLAVPVQFQGALKAHIYVQFQGEPEQQILEKVSEAFLNLGDAIALAVERNQMIAKAEETKTVWEASFDAVEDPVAILDEDYRILRGNRAFGKLANIPLVKLAGREPTVVALEKLHSLPSDQSSEWSMESGGRYYRAFFDPIQEPLGAGRFVLRFHDETEERTLTEKILAKEQVAELGILVGSVAHEINNPIGGILAIGQILQKDIEPKSPLAEDIAGIVQAAERCRKIIQTMLSLVRKADEDRKPVNVTACVQSAVELLGSEAKRLQVKVQENFSRAAGFQVIGNSNRLLQVFFHLLQHSLLAIGERKGKEPFDAFLTVEVIAGFGNVEVKIEDNGDSVKHEYEIQSSVAFTVAKMILEEHEAGYFFSRGNGRNQQRVVLPAGS